MSNTTLMWIRLEWGASHPEIIPNVHNTVSQRLKETTEKIQGKEQW